MFLPDATGGREMISLFPPVAGSPGCGEDLASDVLPTPGCLLPIFPRTAIGNGSGTAVRRRGWSLLARSPSASLPPFLPSHSRYLFRLTDRFLLFPAFFLLKKPSFAKKPFKKYTSPLVVFSLVLNDKYFIKCLPSSLCSSVLSSAVCAVI